MVLPELDFSQGEEPVAFDFEQEYERIEKSLRDAELLIEQSQHELNRLTQRNAAITAHLQQIQANLEKTPVDEIQMSYQSALDAQQRLLVMRGQLEKLQADKEYLLQYRERLQVLEKAVATRADKKAHTDVFASVEMLVNAQEAERQRLSRQMHDGPAQALSNFILQAEIAARLLDMDIEKARVELDNLKMSAMSTFQQVRTFIFELRPMMLDDLGLLPTVKRYVENFREQTGMNFTLEITGEERRLESYQEVLVFRSLQELMDNALRHSNATKASIQIHLSTEALKVVIEDNGKGFDIRQLEEGNSLGLKLIRDRVEMLGGTFEVT